MQPIAFKATIDRLPLVHLHSKVLLQYCVSHTLSISFRLPTRVSSAWLVQLSGGFAILSPPIGSGTTLRNDLHKFDFLNAFLSPPQFTVEQHILHSILVHFVYNLLVQFICILQFRLGVRTYLVTIT